MRSNIVTESVVTAGLPAFCSTAILTLLGTELAPAFQSAMEGTSAWGGFQGVIATALSPLNGLSAPIAFLASAVASIISIATMVGLVAREKVPERQARVRGMATKVLYLGFFVSTVIFTGFLLPLSMWAANQAGDIVLWNLAFLCFGLLLVLPVVLGVNAVRSVSANGLCAG